MPVELACPRQPGGNEFCLRSANHKPCVLRALAPVSGVSCCVLRFWSSVVPLIVAAILARGEFLPAPVPASRSPTLRSRSRPCPGTPTSMSASPTIPAAATVRVRLADSAEAADFAVVDDVDGAEDERLRGSTPATQFVAVSATRSGPAPVIYLSTDGPADYRIFVRSKRFTAREAAALIVGAHGGHRASSRLADAFALNRIHAGILTFINHVLIAPSEAEQPQALCKVAAASSPPRRAGRARQSGIIDMGGFSGSNCAYAASHDAIRG